MRHTQGLSSLCWLPKLYETPNCIYYLLIAFTFTAVAVAIFLFFSRCIHKNLSSTLFILYQRKLFYLMLIQSKLYFYSGLFWRLNNLNAGTWKSIQNSKCLLFLITRCWLFEEKKICNSLGEGNRIFFFFFCLYSAFHLPIKSLTLNSDFKWSCCRWHWIFFYPF